MDETLHWKPAAPVRSGA